MPTYQYECSFCGYQFEVLQSMKEDKLRKCPKCSKFKLNRLIGAGSGIIFKGSGFYETDYKKKDSPKEEAKCGSHCGCHGSSQDSSPKTTPKKANTP